MRVRGLTKRYRDREILGGVDLDISPGETYALLGPNGAGKSTTIEIFEGFRTAGGGEVSVRGRAVWPQGLVRLGERVAWQARHGVVAGVGVLGVFFF